MKHITFALACIMLALSNLTAVADHINRIPITVGQLKVEAERNTVKIVTFITGNAVVNLPDSKTYIEAEASGGFDEVLQALYRQGGLSVMVAKPETDTVDIWSYAYDKRGYVLFAASYQLVFRSDGQGGYYSVCVGSPPVFELVMPSPVEIKGVKQAQFVTRDASGKITRSEYLNVEDGVVFMPDLSEMGEGELILHRDIDGRMVVEVYDLPTGIFRTLTRVWIGVNGWVKNHWRLEDDSSSIYWGPTPLDAVWSLKVNSQDGLNVQFEFHKEGTGELPAGVRLSPRGREPSVWYQVLRPEKQNQIRFWLPPGDWDIVPDFTRAMLP